MYNEISHSKESINRLEEILKNDDSNGVYQHWMKVKTWIGEDRIVFLIAKELKSQENKITIFTKESIFEFTLTHEEIEGQSILTTPIKLTEFKKKIISKNCRYTNSAQWEIEFTYDDNNVIKFSLENLRQVYHPSEINEDLFQYLLNI